VNGTNSLTRFLFVNNITEVLPQVKSNNNLFFVSDGSDGGQFFQIGDAGTSVPTAQYLTFAQWKTQTGQDVSSIFANPQFVNLLGSDGAFSDYGFDADLRLQETSPARGLGALDKKNSYFDFNTLQRYSSDQTVDIGALEYGSNPVVTVKSENTVIHNFALSQNYPNPFNPTTLIRFVLPSKLFVTLKVFDIMGREVAALVNEELTAGSYNKQWNASKISSGIYFYRLQSGSFTETKKLVLLR